MFGSDGLNAEVQLLKVLTTVFARFLLSCFRLNDRFLRLDGGQLGPSDKGQLPVNKDLSERHITPLLKIVPKLQKGSRCLLERLQIQVVHHVTAENRWMWRTRVCGWKQTRSGAINPSHRGVMTA